MGTASYLVKLQMADYINNLVYLYLTTKHLYVLQKTGQNFDIFVLKSKIKKL